MRDFVQIAHALADARAVDLPGDAEYRRIDRVGAGQRGAGIEQAGPGHNAENGGLTGGGGRAERHIGRAFFVAGVDDADAVAVVEEGVVEPVVLDAGQAEEGVDAVGDEGFYGGFSAGFDGALAVTENHCAESKLSKNSA